MTLAEMIAHLKGQVADYKLPEELHIVEELPFTATGKLRRHVLAELDRQGAGAARRSQALATWSYAFRCLLPARLLPSGRDWLRDAPGHR